MNSTKTHKGHADFAHWASREMTNVSVCLCVLLQHVYVFIWRTFFSKKYKQQPFFSVEEEHAEQEVEDDAPAEEGEVD